MPLSEEEQRILHQIEQQFYESDPEFAANVGQASLYRHALRRIVWASVMLLAGLAFLVAMLGSTKSPARSAAPVTPVAPARPIPPNSSGLAEPALLGFVAG
jgi:type VI protein secretion system component VasF